MCTCNQKERNDRSGKKERQERKKRISCARIEKETDEDLNIYQNHSKVKKKTNEMEEIEEIEEKEEKRGREEREIKLEKKAHKKYNQMKKERGTTKNTKNKKRNKTTTRTWQLGFLGLLLRFLILSSSKVFFSHSDTNILHFLTKNSFSFGFSSFSFSLFPFMVVSAETFTTASTASEANIKEKEKENKLTPGKLRVEADKAFMEGKLDASIKYLSQAISMEPDNEKNYYKRYRAYLRLKKNMEALKDLTFSIEKDPLAEAFDIHSKELKQLEKKIEQRAKLETTLGHCKDALENWEKLEKIHNLKIQHGLVTPKSEEEMRFPFIQQKITASTCQDHKIHAEIQIGQGNWGHASGHMDIVLGIADASVELFMKRARIQFEKGDYYSALADAGRVLKLDSDGSRSPFFIEAYQLRGDSYWYLGEIDRALDHYREALRSDPEHKGCKDGHKKVKKVKKLMEKADTLMSDKVSDWQGALTKYLDIIKVDQRNKNIRHLTLVKIAKCQMKLKKFIDATNSIEEVLRSENGNLDAHVQKIELLRAQEKFESALQYIQTLKKEFDGSGMERILDEEYKKTQVELKQSKEVNYYKVLGVDKNATPKEIKSAYRKLAKEYHPDKLPADATEEERKEAADQFARIAQAYEILSDDNLRQRYNNGEDVSSASAQQGQPQGGGGPGGFPGGGFHFHQQHHQQHFHQQHRQHRPRTGGQQFHFRF